MEHPYQKQRDAQKEFLEGLSEEDRPFHEQTFRIGNASFRYYHENEPTKEDYLSWLEGLREPMKSDMTKKGYEACRNVLSLKRHSLELKDLGLDAFMKTNLSTDDYDAWCASKTTDR